MAPTQLSSLLWIASLFSGFSAAAGNNSYNGWGPSVGMGPTSSEIIYSSFTSYPGKYPKNQIGGLFLWVGLGGTDLIQAIIGAYTPGQSECGTGDDADSHWCISAEVYGLDANNVTTQFVGDLTTLLEDETDGVHFIYDMIDRENRTWKQTVTNARTGALMATFTKPSPPSLGWGTAVECQACTGTIDTQTWTNITIKLANADMNLVNTLGAGGGATHTPMVTADGGVTWTMDLITIPPIFPFTPESNTTCNHDNCLRSLIRSGNMTEKLDFCNDYVYAAVPPTPAADVMSKCGAMPARISSACECLPTA